MSLGRMSILDGQIDENGQIVERAAVVGKPFIDDYIITPEPVVDYLTKFSGLEPGDLDPAVSRHHLIPLKAAYLKLRHLIERGCVFVGHGLFNDFRVANIYVPPHQVRDTVELFKLPNRRYISLRFLAAYFLNMNIQSDNHDSVDDARAALLCYQKYEELRENRTLNKTLRAMYAQGKASKWKNANGIAIT
eukprot:GSMAST32.ASY1.ANO1.1815.1 assembled CDS